jgi:hypothetical protein
LMSFSPASFFCTDCFEGGFLHHHELPDRVSEDLCGLEPQDA